MTASRHGTAFSDKIRAELAKHLVLVSPLTRHLFFSEKNDILFHCRPIIL